MQVLEIGPMPRPAHVALVEPFGEFDLDDLGPPVGQFPRGRRPRPHPREIEHLETGERLRGRGKRHAVAPIFFFEGLSGFRRSAPFEAVRTRATPWCRPENRPSATS